MFCFFALSFLHRSSGNICALSAASTDWDIQKGVIELRVTRQIRALAPIVPIDPESGNCVSNACRAKDANSILGGLLAKETHDTIKQIHPNVAWSYLVSSDHKSERNQDEIRRPFSPPSLVEIVSCHHARLKSPKSHSRTKERSLFRTMLAMMGTTGQSQWGQSSQDHEWS